MSRGWTALILVLIASAGFSGRSASAAKEAENEPSVSDLSLEVDALRLLYYIKATPDQMRQLQTLAPETTQKVQPRKGSADSEYLQVLRDLREVLVEATNEQQIEALDDQLDQLNEASKPELDVDIGITDAARRQAPDVLKSFKAPQVAAYIASISDEVADPFEQMLRGLEKFNLSGREWKQYRDNLAYEVGWLVAGLDSNKTGLVSKRVASWLNQARTLSRTNLARFKKERAEIEKAARQIVGETGPTKVLRNTLEHNLAELLSNPRLAAALDARLK